MEKPENLHFDFENYINRLMAEMDLSESKPETIKTIREGLEKQLGLLIANTISVNLNSEDWLKLAKKTPKNSPELMFKTALEVNPSIKDILVEKLDEFFEEITQVYQSL